MSEQSAREMGRSDAAEEKEPLWYRVGESYLNAETGQIGNSEQAREYLAGYTDREGNMHDEYLGDGVYASFDGYHIVLDLRGQDNTTRIALEPSVFDNLIAYRKNLGKKLQEEQSPD